MSPWQEAVDLSEDSGIEVVDLTATTYNKEGSVMGKTKTTSAGQIDLSRLSDEQFQSLLDLSTAALADPEEEVLDDEEEGDEEEEVAPPKSKIRRKRSKTKVTIEKDSEDEGDEEEDEEDEEEVDSTDLSDTDVVAGREALRIARATQIDLADQRWKHEREAYLDAGVPAFMLDLAEPVLKQVEPLTLDLSDTESVDATKIIRDMLDGTKGVVDLTGELGHAIDLSSVGEKDATQEFLDAWDEQYG